MKWSTHQTTCRIFCIGSCCGHDWLLGAPCWPGYSRRQLWRHILRWEFGGLAVSKWLKPIFALLQVDYIAAAASGPIGWRGFARAKCDDLLTESLVAIRSLMLKCWSLVVSVCFCLLFLWFRILLFLLALALSAFVAFPRWYSWLGRSCFGWLWPELSCSLHSEQRLGILPAFCRSSSRQSDPGSRRSHASRIPKELYRCCVDVSFVGARRRKRCQIRFINDSRFDLLTVSSAFGYHILIKWIPNPLAQNLLFSFRLCCVPTEKQARGLRYLHRIQILESRLAASSATVALYDAVDLAQLPSQHLALS